MRQAWINNLRELLAELTSSAVHFYAAGFEDREDKEYQRLTLLEYKIKLMLNIKEEDHKRLDDLISVMISALSQGKRGDAAFADAHLAIIDLSRQLLKREWNRVKEPIEMA